MTDPASNVDRPASFDKAVLAYLPGLKNLAARLTATHADRDDLVSDTMAWAFAKWGNFRGDESTGYRGIHNWLTINMRSMAQTKRLKKAPKFVDDGLIILDRMRGQPASQLDALVAKDQLLHLRGKDAKLVLRAAMGDTYKEIGKRRRVTGEAIRQRADVARGRFADKVGYYKDAA